MWGVIVFLAGFGCGVAWTAAIVIAGRERNNLPPASAKQIRRGLDIGLALARPAPRFTGVPPAAGDFDRGDAP